jgi:hypothetical protein
MKLLWFTAIAFAAMGLACVTPTFADSSDSGAAIGVATDFKADHELGNAVAINDDIAIRELEQVVERPMRGLDTAESGGLDMQSLLVPNQTDYEAAQESDVQSMVSF